MYLDSKSKALSIENYVSLRSNIITFMIKIENQIISKVSNHLIEDS